MIEGLKNQLREANADVKTTRAEALRLANDKDAPSEALEAARKALSSALMRQDILKEELDHEMGVQKKDLQPTLSEVDQIQEGAKPFKSMGDFFRTVGRSPEGNVDARLQQYASIKSAASGQNLTNDADGGYLVPPDYSSELIKLAQSESVLYPRVRKVPISGNRLVTNRLKDEDRADGKRNGGLLAYWIEEAAEYTASSMKFEQDTTALSKLTGLAYATDEMLEDATALGGIIAEGFRDEFAYKIDEAILVGTGANGGAGKPKGILAADNAALVKIAKDSGQAAKTITMQNILNMYNALPARNRQSADWLINQDVELLLMQMLLGVGSATTGTGETQTTITNGVPVFMPPGGLSGSPYSNLLARPMLPVEQCPAVGEVGDIVFADLSQYRWIEKGGLAANVSIHVRFLFDEQAFKFTYRAGGKPIWVSTLKAVNGGTVRSPYVALAKR